jgi:hypothetical protein
MTAQPGADQRVMRCAKSSRQALSPSSAACSVELHDVGHHDRRQETPGVPAYPA